MQLKSVIEESKTTSLEKVEGYENKLNKLKKEFEQEKMQLINSQNEKIINLENSYSTHLLNQKENMLKDKEVFLFCFLLSLV